MTFCLTCGMTLLSYGAYHEHNISVHTFKDLSLTILKIQKFLDRILPFLPMEQFPPEIDAVLTTKDDPKKGGLQTDFMDEVIELGHNEGADNLTIQSLFLKSNLSPFSSQIIEVQESKWSQLAIQELAQKLNGAICHFDEHSLTTECLSNPKKRLLSSEDKKTADLIYAQMMKAKSASIQKVYQPSLKYSVNKREPSYQKSGESSDCVKRFKTSDNTTAHPYCIKFENSGSNVKVVLRSGRTIKKTQKDANFIYFDEKIKDKDKHCKEKSNNPKKVRSTIRSNSSGQNASSTQSANGQNYLSKSSPISKENVNIFTEIWNEIKQTDWDLDEKQLNISIEDLEMHSFEDIEGVFPENQILTIESLLEELEGGGSIEVSNVIKENNLDSGMVVLDALSPGLSEPRENVDNSLIRTDEGGLPFETMEAGVTEACNEGPELLMSQQHTKDLNECLLCQKSYKSRRRFQDHLKKYHTSTNWMKYKCLTCSRSFGFLSTLERHVKQHDPSVKFICKVCGTQFSTLNKLKLHFAIHSRDQKYTCKICNKVYYLKHSYRKHMQCHKFEDARCIICGEAFPSKESLLIHVKKHEKEYLGVSKNLRCNKCSDVKPISDSPSDYLSTGKLIPCVKCCKGFYKRFLILNNSFPMDLPSQHAKEKIRKKCHMCGKNVINLTKHIRECHISNPYVNCDVCGQSVKKSSLPSHKFRKHEGSSVLCDLCNKAFKNILGLNEHMNRAHKEEIPP